MDTKEKIKVMQAYTEGKKIQFKYLKAQKWQDCSEIQSIAWNWVDIEYRIKPEKPSMHKGKFVSYKINRCNDHYDLIKGDTIYLLYWAQSLVGFAGIEYMSPFDPKHKDVSYAPCSFSDKQGWSSNTPQQLYTQNGEQWLPGIPVAVWFWEEEK